MAEWLGLEAQREKLLAIQSVAFSKVEACTSGVLLSDQARIGTIEALRKDHAEDVQRRWQQRLRGLPVASADSILAAVNSVYDAEEQSIVRVQQQSGTSDPDIAKEFPNLTNVIASSRLDSQTKEVLTEGIGVISFAEAGTLARTLEGTDPSAGLGPAYQLRAIVTRRLKAVADSTARASALAVAQQGEIQRATRARILTMTTHYATYAALLLAVVLPLWVLSRKYLARVRAFKTGAKRAPYWGGMSEWVLWDPGETVVLLRNKVMVPMAVKPQQGGIATISAWRGEEYRGRISSKTQLFAWRSEQILTADGLPIRFRLGIWWRIIEPQRYVSRIASEYHDQGEHQKDSLLGAAEVWLEKLAAGTLREQVSKLPSARVISSRAEPFLEVRQSEESDQLSFAREIEATRASLDAKTRAYGINVERIEVQELELPADFQKTIEEMRRAHIEPGLANLESTAYAIRANAKTDVEMRRLGMLADVIGKPAVATKEILKEVDMGAVANPLISMMPVLQPFTEAVKKATLAGLAGSQSAEPEEAKEPKQLPKATEDE